MGVHRSDEVASSTAERCGSWERRGASSRRIGMNRIRPSAKGQVGCSRQLLLLCVLRSGVCSAPSGQLAACDFLKSDRFKRNALRAAEVADGLRVKGFFGVSVTQNESGARVDALVAFSSSSGVGRCPCR